MPDRRATLLALMGASLSSTALARALVPDSTPARPASDADRELGEDLARLGVHEYSDEGIPVFLACVNLAAETSGRITARPSSFSQSVGANIRRYGDAWRAMHPHAPDTDVSKVIEVLAERDFSRGPGETP